MVDMAMNAKINLTELLNDDSSSDKKTASKPQATSKTESTADGGDDGASDIE